MSTTEDTFLYALSEFFAGACIIPRTGITTKDGREFFVCDLPKTMSVIPTCGNLCCANPDHLRHVTAKKESGNV